jgi:hypothetical protein
MTPDAAAAAGEGGSKPAAVAAAAAPAPAPATPEPTANGASADGSKLDTAGGAAAVSAPKQAAAPSTNGTAAAVAAIGDAAAPEEDEESKKSKEYSETMNRRMGTSLHYVHENGLDYNRILPDLIVGSCLQVRSRVACLRRARTPVATDALLMHAADAALRDAGVA